MSNAAKKDDEAERLERLIASNEHAANALNRLAQVLEKREQKRTATKATRVRRTPRRKVVVTDQAEAAAKAALARIRSQR